MKLGKVTAPPLKSESVSLTLNNKRDFEKNANIKV